jgi:hypothetical protein
MLIIKKFIVKEVIDIVGSESGKVSEYGVRLNGLLASVTKESRA